MDKHTEETFAETIKSLSGGEINLEATKLLRDLVQNINQIAANSGGKPKGKLTFSLTIMNDRGVLDVTPELKVTTPSKVRLRQIMYALPDGQLVKNDPRQLMLGVGAKDVSAAGVLDIRSAQANDR